MIDGADDRVLGAIIAGGASSRFGSPKALARVGGLRVIDRVASALRACHAVDQLVAIVNNEEIADSIGLPHRPDVLAGMGALAGVHAALIWARELGYSGVLAGGCDMPFLSPTLLDEVMARRDGHDVVIPESGGPRGVEPLCAFYATGCSVAIEDAIARGNARMIGFHDRVRVQRIPIAVVRRFGDPAVLFMNLNTEADREAAEQLARGAS